MKIRWISFLHIIITLTLFGVALWVIHQQLQAHSYHEIYENVLAIPTSYLLIALCLTVLGYMTMVAYDIFAFKYLKRDFSLGKLAFASFTTFAFSNNIGLSILTNASLRFKFYTPWGLSPLEISTVIGLCILTFWLGFFTVGGSSFLIDPYIPPYISPLALKLIGLFMLLSVLAYLILSGRKISWRGRVFTFPSLSLSLGQILVSSLDWVIAAFIFYALLGDWSSVSFTHILCLFMFAQVAGLLAHVPGGIGIFESIMLAGLSDAFPASKIFGVLVVYRLIYYIFPLVTAGALLLINEVVESKKSWIHLLGPLGKIGESIIPQFMGGLVFCAGVILLLSGATPTLPHRLIWLEKMLPLPLIEFSHFLGSLVGTALLFLAVGMFKRLDASYFLTLFLLAFGALFSILKGLDYEEAVVLGTLFFLLLPCHRYFNRQASLLAAGFSGAWFMAIFLAISSSIWLGFFAYRHVEYDHELWWEFSFDGDAPRFLRAMVGTQLIVLLFALAKLFKTRPPDDHATLQESPELIKNLVRSSPNTTATLALLGDKYFFFNQKKNAFIMYALSGQSWVTLSDPVGAEEEFPELIWLFTERANHYGFRPIFYQITDRYLPLYIDLGMILLKIGEEAMMPLKDFSLEGRQGKKLRLNRNRLIDEGFQFSIVPVNQVPTILPVMESISNQWLSHKSAREKGFSIGYFDKNYLLNFPVALIKKGEQAVAFANILEGANKEELSVDLMRFIPEVGHGLMDYLFAELFLWGKEQGLARFNIGMAPLSGLSNRPMATWWHKLGKIVYEYGEHFYNFQGLRDYKEKFHPVWESRYIAAPGAFSLPAALANIATLVSRGIKGIWAK